MSRLRFLVLPALFLLLFSAAASAEQAIIPMDHFPPWKIVRDGVFDGIDLQLISTLLREVGISPRFVSRPWPRCLDMIETGEADILTGVLKRPEREKYMHFIEPPYKTRSSKAFYILKGAPDIAAYEDLRGKRIGVLRAAKYFKRFDEDTTLVKREIHAQSLNFMKLSAGRVDVLIETEDIGDYLLKNLDLGRNIVKASYRYDTEIPVHFVVSRQSPLMGRIKELEAAAQRFQSSGEFDRIIREFRTRPGQ